MVAVYLFFCTLLAYVVKGVAGFGNTLVLNGLFSLTVSNRLTSPADLLISFPANLYLVWRERASLDVRVAAPLAAMLVAGLIPGIWLLKVGSDWVLKTLLGVVIMGLAVEMGTRKEGGTPAPITRGRRLGLLAVGLVSGVLAGLFGIGALLAAYVSRTTDNQSAFRANLCMVFLVDNIVRIPAYAATGILTAQALQFALFLAPAAALGLMVSARWGKRLPQRAVRLITCGMLFVSGAALVIQNGFFHG